ncbi:MAG: hypothetical protein A2W19_09190 [Spirochaetes bacterium RBG_16_49_21]|nr:MAG: hypothetical protein A2W19_09190 [Spirochaetes bacterium RBG_16_49_21]
MFKRVAIFGLGLLGGSLCKGLKRINPGIHIAAYGRDVAKLDPLLHDNYADEVRSYGDLSLAGIDLAVVAMPAKVSIEIIRLVLDHRELEDGAIITDVGSVKERIIASILECGRARQFIGCHPMAGSEKIGFEFSDGALFEGASVIVTPHRYNQNADISRIRKLWEMLGSKTFIVSPEEHDTFVAYTSHLPHIIASSLVALLDDFRRGCAPSRDLRPFVGRGFMDATRISSGSPDMWRDIVLLNKMNILDAVSLMIDKLEQLRNAIQDAESRTRFLHDYFIEAKKIRDMLE